MPSTQQEHDNFSSVARSMRRPNLSIRFAAPAVAVAPPPPSEVISIASDSEPQPEEEEYEEEYEEEVPASGILPHDSLQGEPVNSIELKYKNSKIRTGIAHYNSITKHTPHQSIQVDFSPYITAPPANAAPREVRPEPPSQILSLGAPQQGINYNEHPKPVKSYSKRIYRGSTHNPLIALAIIRIAQKNLPLTNFTSALTHLPNIGLDAAAPVFPPTLTFLDTCYHHPSPTDVAIGVIFLPDYYCDGRHALGFYTGEAATGKLYHNVVAPCVTGELEKAGLVRVVGKDGADGGDYWGKREVGVKRGKWFYVEDGWPMWVGAERMAREWAERLQGK